MDAEYLGFNNRTCSTNITPRRTAGPVMRGPSKSMMWREWMIRVNHDVDKSEEFKSISMQAFIHPDLEDDAKCQGFVSTFYDSPEFKGACKTPPYGSALYLNSTKDNGNESSQTWKIRLFDGSKAEFEMIASNKPGECQRVLAV